MSIDCWMYPLIACTRGEAAENYWVYLNIESQLVYSWTRLGRGYDQSAFGFWERASMPMHPAQFIHTCTRVNRVCIHSIDPLKSIKDSL